MRLTSEILLSAENYLNVYRDREINLRGLKIPAIENLSLLQDQYDVMDFSDNDIKKLDNFPKMTRLITLLFHNNQISKIASSLGTYLINLQDLILTNNKISSLIEIKSLLSCTKLMNLILLENPISYLPNYRYYIIYILPQLKSLDYNKITKKEKQEAMNLFQSTAGKVFLQQLEQEIGPTTSSSSSSVVVKPFNTALPIPPIPSSISSIPITPVVPMIVPSAVPVPPPAPPAVRFTDEQKQQIKIAIEKATTGEEIDIIEHQLKTGTFPFTTSNTTTDSPVVPLPPKVNAIEMDID